MKIGYIRVSTAAQNIDRQVDALRAAGCERIYVDKLSGRNANRPELQRMFEQFREGDVLVITELSRLGRSLPDLLELSNCLFSMGVDLQSLKEPAISTTSGATGRLFFNIMAAIAEFQRELNNELIRDGMEAAKAKGKVQGRPKVDEAKLKTALALYDSQKFSVQEICRQAGISKGSFYKYLNESLKSTKKEE